jgi:DNA helicase-2/ATP-dependent DNA helicase PcrA
MKQSWRLTLLELSDERKAIVSHTGHLLIKGGPGSGKTTISIVKAESLVATLKPGQQVLFLSFARATVARVIEALAEQTKGNNEVRRRIEIDTYHAFFWRLLKTHAYLIGLPRRVTILTPPARAIALTPIRHTYGSARKLTDTQKTEKLDREEAELRRLAFEEGKVCFDLFSELVVELVSKSEKLRKLVSTRYPIIILDEFQDTSAGQWAVVENLGSGSALIALADEEQRIYDFAGADPERLNHFKQKFDPKEFDFGTANYRSNGTDIARFGNDVLAGKLSTNKYAGVGLVKFAENSNQAMAALKGQTLQAIERLRKTKGHEWSLAILVPTKQFMREVSDALRETQGTLPRVEHNAAIDMEGAILAAELIAFLLQPHQGEAEFAQLIGLLSNFFRGKGGDDPSASDIGEALAIEKALQKAVECVQNRKPLPKTSIIRLIKEGYHQCVALTLTGNPGVDWLAVRKVFAECGCKRLAQVAEEARNVRLLDRGTQLRESLSLDWRTNGAYKNALEIVRQAFVQEHFSTSVRKQSGVIVMNMHKAKGKQFDEVIIFEGWPRRVRGQIVGNPHRIVRGNMDGDLTHATYNFRVSVTRARSRTTIMTPENDPCILLVLASRAAKAAAAQVENGADTA